MTWEEANLSLQLAAEERIGTLLRQRQAEAVAREDAAWASFGAQVRRMSSDGPR